MSWLHIGSLISFGLIGLLLTCRQEAFAVEIIGHRGASYEAPENTLAAVNLAWQNNADAVETDVFLTKDDRIIAIHDETTKRYGGPDRKIAQQTLAELRRLDVGAWKNPRWEGERIPTLSEVLQTIPKQKRLFIEIKCGPEIIPELQRVLDAADRKPNQLALIGFSYKTMQAVKRQLPHLSVFWVVKLEKKMWSKTWQPSIEALIRKSQSAKLHGLHLNNTPAIDHDYVAKVKQAGLELYVWTVNDPKEAARLKAAGIDGITTDRPGWLRQQIGGGLD